MLADHFARLAGCCSAAGSAGVQVIHNTSSLKGNAVFCAGVVTVLRAASNQRDFVMRVFKPALTCIAFAFVFGGVFMASFVLTATVHRGLGSIASRTFAPG